MQRLLMNLQTITQTFLDNIQITKNITQFLKIFSLIIDFCKIKFTYESGLKLQDRKKEKSQLSSIT